ncbi:MAG: GAF domain-containing protein, partial [Chloroflexi bacterium]|nr:GAF domain-containing protein [Chloroflexota bacterium]
MIVRRHRILLVDDEADVRFTLSKVLETEGFDVTAAAGAADAMRLIERERFDAVVADMQLADGGDGFEVCRHARERDPEAVTIILTAYASFESAVAAVREQVSNYLGKPTDIRELKLAITSAIETRDLRAALRQATDEIGAKTEAMQQQSELLELAREAILVRALASSAITYWNRGAEATYGWSRGEALGQVTHSLLRTQFPTSLEDVDAELAETGHWEGELEHSTRDGRRIVVESRQSVQRDAEGRATAVLEVNRDVTQRRAALETRLRLVEERAAREAADAGHRQLLQLLAQVPAAICVLRGPNHVFEFNNAAHAAMIGGREVTGRRVIEAFPELAGSGRIELLDEVYRSGEAVAKTELAARIAPPGGGGLEDGYINVTYQPLRDAQGQVEGVVACALDVTQQVRARRRLEVLAAVGRALAGPLVYEHLLDRLAHSVVPDFADWCVVDVVDEEQLAQHVAVAHVDPAKEPLAAEVQRRHEPISSPGSPMRRVLESGEPLLVRELTAGVNEAGAPDADYLNKVRQLEPRSMICVALRVREQAIGVMSFLTSESSRRYSEDDVELATEIGRQAAAAIENAQLYRQTQEEVGERRQAEDRLRFLAEAGRVLQSSLDYERTIASVAQLAVPQLADWCAVHIVEGDRLACPALAHRDPEKVRAALELQERWPPDMEDASGLPNVLRTGKPELYPELSDELMEAGARDAEHLEVVRRLGPWSSALVAPLIARGRTLGALTLIAGESGRRYGPADVDFAMELAGRAGMAIDNARLLQRARESRLQAERLQALTQKLATSLEVESVLQEIAATAAELLHAPVAGVFLQDRPDADFKLVAGQGFTLAEHEEVALPYSRSLASRVVQGGKAEIVSDARNAPVTALPELVAGEAKGSLLVAPIVSRATGAAGVVEVYAPAVNAFDEYDADVLLTLASAAGSALANARTFTSEQRARTQAERLQALTEQLAKSEAPEDVLDQIAAMAAELLRSTVAGVFLLDSSGEYFDLVAGRGLNEGQGIRLVRRESLAGRLIETGGAEVISDVGKAPVTALPKLVSGQAVGSLVVAPIVAGPLAMGAVEVYSATTGAFDEGDGELLSALAAAAATTLQKARSLDAERRARREAERLQELTSQLSGSLEPERVLDHVAATAAELLEARVSGVFILDPSGQTFEMVAGRGLEGCQLPRDSSVAGRVIEAGVAEVIADVSEAPVTALPKLVSGEPAGSLVVAPIISTAGPVGVIEVYSTEIHAFDEHHGRLLAALAGPAAAVLENAWLYRQRQVDLTRLQTMVDQLPAGVIVVEAASGAVSVRNRQAEQLFGSAVSSLGSGRGDVPRALRADRTAYSAEAWPLARALQGETINGERIEVEREDGGRSHLAINAAPIRDERGLVIAAVAVFDDVSAEEELRRQKDQFLAAAAHDLRTPLTSIRGLAQLLERQISRLDIAQPERVLASLGGIGVGTHKMASLIDEMLDMSRLDAGHMLSLNRADMDLVELSKTVLEAQRGNAPQHRLEFQTDVERLSGRWDESRLERVVSNLVQNAIKYSPEG